MGKIRAVKEGRECLLEPEHLVGRGPQCSLRLSASYVSAQHAVIRWSGAGWDLLDRGSRNGTHLDGCLIERGSTRRVEQGSVIAFGHPDERWEIVDSTEPQVSVVPLDTGEPILGIDGVIGLPSNDDAQCTLFRDMDGQWRIESTDRETILRNGNTFSVNGRLWRFCCPEPPASTMIAEPPSAPRPSAAQPESLHFSTSSDEEYVELDLLCADRKLVLGSRSHNYLLLLLARSRLADRTAGISESSCGWTCKEDLADALRVTPQQIDGEIFRIRKHFAQCGASQAATIIERRHRTKQIRIGIPDVSITKL